jgi:adenosine/AMP kinase
VAAGHTFIIVLKDAFPINVLNAIKMCQEVCTIYCATANPVEVIIAETDQGRGIMGVIDGASPQGIEDDAGVQWRRKLLRDFGYKL